MKIKHYVRQKYYKESNNILIKIEIIEITKNLIFFKYTNDAENPKFPFESLTKYRFLPEDEFDVYVAEFDETNKNWR